MHPAREAETLLHNPDSTEEDREKAMIWAILALGDSIDGLGHDIREGCKDIATELGGISTSSLLSDAPSFVITKED